MIIYGQVRIISAVLMRTGLQPIHKIDNRGSAMMGILIFTRKRERL